MSYRPSAGPRKQDPRHRVPAVSRLPRLPILRPGLASYNSVLCPPRQPACHARCYPGRGKAGRGSGRARRSWHPSRHARTKRIVFGVSSFRAVSAGFRTRNRTQQSSLRPGDSARSGAAASRSGVERSEADGVSLSSAVQSPPDSGRPRRARRSIVAEAARAVSVRRGVGSCLRASLRAGWQALCVGGSEVGRFGVGTGSEG